MLVNLLGGCVRHPRRRPGVWLATAFTMTLLPLAGGVGGGVWMAVLGWDGPSGHRRLIEFVGAPFGPGPRYAPDEGKLDALRGVLDDVTAFRSGQVVVESEHAAGRFVAAVVGGNYFDVLEARLRQGSVASWRRGGVVLSARGATRLFGDGAAIGRTVRVHGRPAYVAAVLREGDEYPREADIWLPFGLADEPFVTDYVALTGVGRLRSSIAMREVGRAIEALLGHSGSVALLGARARERSATVASMAAVGAMAMAGVATATILLLMWGAAARERECDATRSALGATRIQLYQEHVARLVGPMVVAIGLSGWLGTIVTQLISVSHAAALNGLKRVEWSMEWWGWGVAVLVGLVLVVSRRTVREATGLCVVRQRLGGGRIWLALQVSLSVVLVVTGLGLARSVRAFYAIPFGFDPDGVLVVDASLPARVFKTAESRRRAWERLIADVSALPGVAGAAVTTAAPFAAERVALRRLRVVGATRSEGAGAVVIRAVSPGYFRVLGGDIEAGRSFNETDGVAADTCVIQENVARRAFCCCAGGGGTRDSNRRHGKTNCWRSSEFGGDGGWAVAGGVHSNAVCTRVPGDRRSEGRGA